MSTQHYIDRFTGKPFDRISQRLPKSNGETCDHCGGECIDNCMRCGAPQCCPACCADSEAALRKAQPEKV